MDINSYARDGLNAIQVSEGKWIVALTDCELSRDKYSKSWHRQYGPAKSYSNRRVCEATPVTPDHRVVGMRADGAAAAMVTIGNVIKNFDRWPAGGELAACVECVPFEDLLLLTNHPSARVVEFVKKRFTRGT